LKHKTDSNSSTQAKQVETTTTICPFLSTRHLSEGPQKH